MSNEMRAKKQQQRRFIAIEWQSYQIRCSSVGLHLKIEFSVNKNQWNFKTSPWNECKTKTREKKIHKKKSKIVSIDTRWYWVPIQNSMIMISESEFKYAMHRQIDSNGSLNMSNEHTHTLSKIANCNGNQGKYEWNVL